MNEQAQAVVDSYMRDLKRELRALPRDRRKEILEDIEGHIDQSLGRNGSAGEADARTVIDQLGDPSDIAAEARERFGIQPSRFGALEIWALILLPFFWIVGVVLLWSSNAWTRKEKLIGTLVPPGGLWLFWMMFALAVTSSDPCGGSTINPRTGQVINQTCSGGGTSFGDILFGVAWVLAGLLAIVVPIWLGLRARSREA